MNVFSGSRDHSMQELYNIKADLPTSGVVDTLLDWLCDLQGLIGFRSVLWRTTRPFYSPARPKIFPLILSVIILPSLSSTSK